MNRYTIVCESLTGNTAMLAEAIRSHLQEAGIEVYTPEQADPDRSDIFFVGSWTDKGDCAAKTAAFLEKLDSKKVFLFGTCGFGRSEAYYDTVYHRFADHIKSTNQIIGHYICQGKMPGAVLQRYQAMKAANPDCSRWDECIENFEQALSHPNRQDLESLCQAVDQAIKE